MKIFKDSFSSLKKRWQTFTDNALKSVVGTMSTASQIWQTVDLIDSKKISSIVLSHKTGNFLVAPSENISELNQMLERICALIDADISVEPALNGFSMVAVDIVHFFIDSDGYYVEIDEQLDLTKKYLKALSVYMDENVNKHTDIARKVNKAMLFSPTEDILLFATSLLDIQRGKSL